MRVYIDDPVLDTPIRPYIADPAFEAEWIEQTLRVQHGHITAPDVKDGAWWLEEAAPGETRIDRLCYMLREVFSRYDAPDCDIALDGRTVRLNVDPRR